MDSDGNFRISRRHVETMRWPHYRINVRCAQVEPSPAVALLATTFGGQVRKKKDERPGHRDLAAWGVHDRAAIPAIEALLPYLRVKWVDACLLLELRDLKSRMKEDLTSWVHGNRWHQKVEMHKRSYSSGQVADFERVRASLRALHDGSKSRMVSVPAAPD